jgi:hypothetical protein
VDDAILMDGLARSVVEPEPASTYEIVATGTSGAERVRQQVLVMFKDGVSGELQVLTVSAGATIDSVATWNPLLAVGLGWGERDEGGATVLRPGPPDPSRPLPAARSRPRACPDPLSPTCEPIDLVRARLCR